MISTLLLLLVACEPQTAGNDPAPPTPSGEPGERIELGPSGSATEGYVTLDLPATGDADPEVSQPVEIDDGTVYAVVPMLHDGTGVFTGPLELRLVLGEGDTAEEQAVTIEVEALSEPGDPAVVADLFLGEDFPSAASVPPLVEQAAQTEVPVFERGGQTWAFGPDLLGAEARFLDNLSEWSEPITCASPGGLGCEAVLLAGLSGIEATEQPGRRCAGACVAALALGAYAVYRIARYIQTSEVTNPVRDEACGRGAEEYVTDTLDSLFEESEPASCTERAEGCAGGDWWSELEGDAQGAIDDAIPTGSSSTTGTGGSSITDTALPTTPETCPTDGCPEGTSCCTFDEVEMCCWQELGWSYQYTCPEGYEPVPWGRCDDLGTICADDGLQPTSCATPVDAR